MILRYDVTRGGYTIMQTPCLEGPDDNMGIVHRVLQQDYPKLRLLLEIVGTHFVLLLFVERVEETGC